MIEYPNNFGTLTVLKRQHEVASTKSWVDSAIYQGGAKALDGGGYLIIGMVRGEFH
jgi:hypothetical protein